MTKNISVSLLCGTKVNRSQTQGIDLRKCKNVTKCFCFDLHLFAKPKNCLGSQKLSSKTLRFLMYSIT